MSRGSTVVLDLELWATSFQVVEAAKQNTEMS